MKQALRAITIPIIFAVVLSSAAFGMSADTGTDTDAVATITKMENDSVKADLANDSTFYENYLADNWTGGTSRGTWETKQSVLADFKDPKNNKTNSEKISDLKVRADGDTAVATYKSSYDSLVHGKRYVRTIISTDVFQKQNGTWKQIASHSSMVPK
jgi:ketosteroid isomerase-like protein